MIHIKWERRIFETYFEAIDELCPANVAVLVEIEGVEDDSEFLSGKEDAKF